MDKLCKKNKDREFNYKLLMLTTLIISGCSIIYEILISSVSSYLVGDSVKQFSITIGLYMSAMGIGSYLSKYIKRYLFDWLVFVEIAVGVLGGFTSLILFSTNAYLKSYFLTMYALIIAIGILVGLEIPLLTRIMEKYNNNLSLTISNIFSFDYIGGLVGSVIFPLVLLPHLGYFSTSFLVGMVNIATAIIILVSYKGYIRNYKNFKSISVMVMIIMGFCAIFSEQISSTIEDRMYRDKVIYSEQTKYQRIVMTRYKDDIRLFLDGNIQFASIDEYRYHEALVHIPMSLVNEKRNVLILGGGDGMAVRELLKYEDVTEITLVDLDKRMVELCKEHGVISKLNEKSLESEKLKIVNKDAFGYLEDVNEKYDVIIVDLPDPNNETLNKLYTNLFYRLCNRALNDEGVMVVQSTSPFSATKAFWSINKTIESEGFNVYPYHLEIPSFGDWGFNLASKKELDINSIEISVKTKYLDEEIIPRLFAFSKDEKIEMNSIERNTLSNPKLIDYYQEAVEKWS